MGGQGSGSSTGDEMTGRRGRLATAVTMALGIALATSTAVAEPRTLEIGALRIAYDTARWSISGAGDAFQLDPAGASGNERGRLIIERHAIETGGCSISVRAVLFADHYAPPIVASVEVAGLAGLSAMAHSRCRSAQPRGIAVCVEVGGSAYVIVSRKSACRGAGPSPFSDADPLAEIVAGISTAH